MKKRTASSAARARRKLRNLVRELKVQGIRLDERRIFVI